MNLREDYAQYCTECRWYGQRPLTFTQWVGEEYGEPREAAQERAAELWENDTWDMY